MKSKTSCLPQHTVCSANRRKHQEKNSEWMVDFIETVSLFSLALFSAFASSRQKNVVESRGTAGSWGEVKWWASFLLCLQPPQQSTSFSHSSVYMKPVADAPQSSRLKKEQTLEKCDAGPDVTAALHRVAVCECTWLTEFTWPGATVTSGLLALQTNDMLDKCSANDESSELFVLLLRCSHTTQC